jgi:hypothetical protein
LAIEQYPQAYAGVATTFPFHDCHEFERNGRVVRLQDPQGRMTYRVTGSSVAAMPVRA